jgi:hypothetical protein
MPLQVRGATREVTISQLDRFTARGPTHSSAEAICRKWPIVVWPMIVKGDGLDLERSNQASALLETNAGKALPVSGPND